MDDIIVLGAGPAGLLAAWIARKSGARVRIMAAGIGTTHVAPGWLGVLDTKCDLEAELLKWCENHPNHPYAIAGVDSIKGGVDALREVCSMLDLHYVGDGKDNYELPTALGAVMRVAYVPESFAAGDLRTNEELLIAGPVGWRDFYPKLCAGNLRRQGYSARNATFALPEGESGKFDATPADLARLFERADVRERVASQLRPVIQGATRVGLPAVIGLERSREAWLDLQVRLGVPVFEIPTLPPSVPGLRLFAAFKKAFASVGIQLLLDMTAVRGIVEDNRALAVVVPNVARDAQYGARQIILATGGIYGGGIVTNRRGEMREAVFDLQLHAPGQVSEWFADQLIGETEHAIHDVGVFVNEKMQPVDDEGHPVLENVRIAGRLIAQYHPLAEGSTEGVWLATAYRAATQAIATISQ